MTKPSLMTDLLVVCLELPLGLLGRRCSLFAPVRSRLRPSPESRSAIASDGNGFQFDWSNFIATPSDVFRQLSF